VKKPSGRKQSKRRAKLNIPLADTGGRDADLVSADTSANFAAQAGRSTTSADNPCGLCS
jgi:hypothetical protein